MWHNKGFWKTNVEWLFFLLTLRVWVKSSWQSAFSCNFNIFCPFNDIDNEMECSLSKFADGTKLSSAGDTTKGRDVIQGYLGKTWEVGHKNLMNFNKSKCKVLHLDQSSPRYQDRLGEEVIEMRAALWRGTCRFWWTKSWT